MERFFVAVVAAVRTFHPSEWVKIQNLSIIRRLRPAAFTFHPLNVSGINSKCSPCKYLQLAISLHVGIALCRSLSMACRPRIRTLFSLAHLSRHPHWLRKVWNCILLARLAGLAAYCQLPYPFKKACWQATCCRGLLRQYFSIKHLFARQWF